MSNLLADQTVVVIGGTSGIGDAVARGARAEGASVTVASRRSPMPLDVSDPASVEAFFEKTGPFDHLVVSVIQPSGGRIDGIDLSAAKRSFETKYWGAFHAIRSAAGRIRRPGSITLVGGVAAWNPSIGGAVMASVNMALVPLAQVAALELAPVRVNVLSPGIIDTPNWNGMPGEKRTTFFADIASTVPAGRVGAPADIAHAVMFLMTNPYVTGTVLHVEGGLLLS
jgi:NAD(P)-dependent dehydrogenase (short-subunit alcohol dehydrogenase family)